MSRFVTAIAMVALAVLAMPASAEHCKGKHQNDPDCGGAGDGAQTPVPVVRDSLGNLIGTWLPNTYVLIKGDPTGHSYFETRTFVKVEYRAPSPLVPAGFNFNARPVHFTGDFCTGQAFTPSQGQVGDIFFASTSLDASGDITMWLPTDPTIPTQSNIHVECVLTHQPQQPGICDCSSGPENGAPCKYCNMVGNMINVVEVEPIQTELGNFVPDFTITE